MKCRFSVLILALFPSVWPGAAGCAQTLPLRLTGGWIQAVPPSAEASVAFFRIVNSAGETFELAGARTSLAESVEPMVTTRDAKGMSGMESVPALKIPAHGELVLQPGGDHLMLMNLRQHPNPGDNVTLTLIINPGRKEMQVTLPVLRQAPKENENANEHHPEHR
jgi:periplasmic copper chaperone A